MPWVDADKVVDLMTKRQIEIDYRNQNSLPETTAKRSEKEAINTKKQEAIKDMAKAKYNFEEVVKALIKLDGDFTANHVFDLLKVEPNYVRTTVNFNNMKRSLDKEFNLAGYELVRKGSGMFAVQIMSPSAPKNRVPKKPQIKPIAYESVLPEVETPTYEVVIDTNHTGDTQEIKLGGPAAPKVDREVLKAMIKDIQGDSGLMEAFNMVMGATYGFKAVPVTTWELVEV